jgi:hypothetical protein
MSQKILLKAQRELLRKNAIEHVAAQLMGVEEPDHKPVVKFFNPCGASTWLISQMDEDGRMYGLCDLGMGFPELGYVMLDEITSIRVQFGLKIERDMHFKATKTLSEYADEARIAGRIAA